MARPSVYVVVLNFNTRDATLQLIESLKRLVYPNVHIVVVDNGSKDNCAAVVSERWPEIKVFALPNNLGHGAGFNVGIRYALDSGADYVLPINSDMVADPRLVDELVDVAEKDPSYGMIASRIYVGAPPSDEVQYNGGHYSLWTGFSDGDNRGEHHGRDEMLELREVTFTPDCCLVPARVLRKIGLLDESLFCYSEDVDWSVRAIRAGYKIMMTPRAVIWHVEVRAVPNAWRYRMCTRNLFLVHWRYARWYHHLTAVPYILLRWVLYMSFREVLHRRWTEAAALWKGLIDAFRGRTGSAPRK
ncbi:glycosyltransferase family 2 protein [Candidatus Sumerlaeota bacterium]|nr:glycosyltransferase family 2 protein [Candidatus Sumerlaeota bacterium]